MCNLLLINGSVNERTPPAPISSFSSPLFFFSTSKYMHWREILLLHSYPFEWMKKKATNEQTIVRASELHWIMSTIIIERSRQYCPVSIDYAKMFMGDWDRFNSMRQLFICTLQLFSFPSKTYTYRGTDARIYWLSLFDNSSPSFSPFLSLAICLVLFNTSEKWFLLPYVVTFSLSLSHSFNQRQTLMKILIHSVQISFDDRVSHDY